MAAEREHRLAVGTEITASPTRNPRVSVPLGRGEGHHPNGTHTCLRASWEPRMMCNPSDSDAECRSIR